MILSENRHNVDKFNEIYQQDRLMARIYALEKHPYVDYIVLNETAIDIFQIFHTRLSYGVSKTLKRYVSKKTTSKIFVNKTKFYIKNTKILRPLSLDSISSHLVRELFFERFQWMKNIQEYNFYNLSFNTIIKHKLYNRDKLLRHLYKCPFDKALIIKNHFGLKDWQFILKASFNYENINPEILNDSHLLLDACMIGWKLNKKVNLTWSIKRLKAEHDKFARIYTKYVTHMDNEPLNIREIYKDFNIFIGSGLITQSGDLVYEGIKQGHCVAGYKDRINSGHCAIFRYNGYTAEINCYNKSNLIYLGQFRGFKNCCPPKYLQEEIEVKIQKFNQMNNKNYSEPVLNYVYDQQGEGAIDWF